MTLKNKKGFGKTSKRFLALAIAAAAGTLGLVRQAAAGVYYWDTNGTTAGFGSAAGTWGGSADWNSDATGVLTSTAYTTTTSDTAYFGTDVVGYGYANTGSATVTVSSTQNIGNIYFGAQSGAITLSGGTLAFGTFAGTITANNSADTFSSVLTGTAGITKAGSGTLTLNGSAVNTFTGGTSINGGTLLLDFANLSTPTNLINSANTLTLAGGSLLIKGKTGAFTTAQTLGNVTVNAGGGSLLVDTNTGTGTNITLGTITSTAAGGSFLIGKANSNTGTLGITTTTNKDATGIYGPRIVFTSDGGTTVDYATTISGSSPYTLSAYSSYTALGTTGTGSTTTNYNMTANVTQTGGTGYQANTLKMVGGVTLAEGSGNWFLANGILATGSAAATISGTAATYQLAAGTGTGGDLVIQQYNTGGLTISAVIGQTSGATTLTKAGPGALTLSGSNLYTGGTYINAGTLKVGNATALGGNAGAVTVASGATLDLNGITMTNTNPLSLTGNGVGGNGALINSNATAATYAGVITLAGTGATITANNALTVSTGTANAIVGSGSTTLTFGGTNTLTMQTTTTTPPISGAVPITINSGTFYAFNSSGSVTVANPFGTGAITLAPGATLKARDDSGTENIGNNITISNAVGTATIANGNGTENFSGSITFATGANTPTLALTNGNGVAGGDSFSGIISGPGNITYNGSANGSPLVLSYAGAGGISLTGGTLSNLSSNAAGTVSVTGNLSGNTAVLENSTGNAILTLSGSNTFTGGVTITQGTVKFTNLVSMPAGVNVTAAAGTTVAVNVGGTGQWTTGTSGNGTIGGLLAGQGAQSGETVTYAGAFNLGIDTTNASPTTQTYSGVLNNISGNALGITKLGTNTLALAAANGYTGTTTVNAGTLSIVSPGTLGGGTAPLNFTGAATLDLGTTGQTVGAVTLSAATGGITIQNGTLTGSSYTSSNTSGTNTISAVLGGSGTLSQTGAGGTLLLSGANTYTGQTTISGGTISVGSINYVTTGSLATHATGSNLGIPGSAANGTIVLGGTINAGTLVYTGTGETTDRVLNLAGTTGGATITQSGTGLLDFTSNLTLPGAGIKTLTLNGSTAGTGQIDGIILDNSSTNTTSISKGGTGVWTLTGANTYTGVTDITGGVLNVASLSNYGASGSLGSRALGSETLTGDGIGIHLAGGTLQYTGSSAQSTNRQIRIINGTSPTIDASGTGSGTLSFTGTTNTNLFDTGGTRTLNLIGSNTGANTFNLIIADQNNTYTAGVSTAGATSLTKSGVGNWNLTGSNIYTGVTTISGGTLTINNIANAGLTPTITTTAGSATATVSSATGLQVGMIVEDTAILSGNSNIPLPVTITNINGTTLTLSTGTNITAGTYGGVIGYANPLGLAQAASGNLVFNGGTLAYTGTSASTNRGFTLTGAGTIDVPAATALTFGGVVAGAGSLTKTDSGTLVLGSATNSFGGAAAGLILSAGTVQFATATNSYSSANGTGAMLTVNAGTLDMNGNSFQIGNLTGIGGTIVNNATGTSTLTIGGGPAGTGTYSGVIADNNNAGTGTLALTKVGNVVITLAGANTYTGTTKINGILNAGGPDTGTSGPFGNGGTITFANTSGPGILQYSASNQYDYSGRIKSSTASAINIDTNGQNVTWGGTLAASNTAGLILADTAITKGTLTLNGTASYGGGTTVSGGSLFVNTALPAGTAITVNGGTLNANAIGALTGGTSLAVSSGAAILTSSNNFTGATSLTGGILQLQDSGAIASSSSLTLGGGTLQMHNNSAVNFTTPAITLTPAGTTTIDVGQVSSGTGLTLGVTGAVGLAGTTSTTTTLNVTSANNYVLSLPTVNVTNTATAATQVKLDINPTTANATVGTFTGTVSTTAGNDVYLLLDGGSLTSNAVTGLISQVNTASWLYLTKQGNSTWSLAGNNTSILGPTVVSAGILNLQNSNALGTAANGTSSVTSGATLQVQGGINVPKAFTLNGVGYTAGGATGALESVNNSNTFSGLITLGAAATIASDISGTTLTLSNAGTITGATFGLTVAGAGNTTINSIIGTTSGTLNKTGAGALTLTGANTYTGGTTLGAGTLNINNATALGTAAGTFMINGGTLDNTSAAAITTNSYPLTINSDITFTGTQALNLGTGATTLGTTAGTMRTITVNNSMLTLGGNIGIGTSATGLTKAGTGALTLSGANTYTGGTTLSAGTLNINSATALGTVAGSFMINGGTLDNTSGAAKTLTANNPITIGNSFAYSTSAGTANNNLNLGTGAVTLNLPPTITLNGAGTLTFGGPITGLGTYAPTLTGSGTGGVTFSGAAALTADLTLTNNSAGTLTFSGALSGTNNLFVTGTGVTALTGANTYTGTTTVTSGTLSTNNVVVAGGNSGLGNATSAVVLGGAGTKGTLLYTGAAATYTRNFTINAGGGEVDSNTNTVTLLPGTTPAYAPIDLTNGPLTLGTGTTAATTYITIGSATMTGPMFTGANPLTINGNAGGVGIVKLTNLTGYAVTSAAMPINIMAGQLQYAYNGTAAAVSNLLGTGLITLTPAAANGGQLNLSVGGITDTLGNAIQIADAAGTATIVNSGAITINKAVTGPSGANTPTLLLQNSNGSAFTLTLSGGIAGKLNVQLQGTNNSANCPITLSTTAINNAGTISNITATGSAVMTVSAPIGSNVTGLSQNGVSPFTISSALNVGGSYALSPTFTSSGTGLWTLSGGISGTGNLVFNANSTGGITVSGTAVNYSGTITNSGTSTGGVTISANIGANVSNITQSSATSYLLLSGTNTYTGGTSVTAGQLDFYSASALPNYASPANTKLTVASSGILALGYAGTGQFSATDVANMLNGTFAVSYAATGASLGLDTGLGSASYTGVVTNASGTTSFGLVKLGANTLTLGTANTYTGPTAVWNGTLSVASLNNVAAPLASSSLGAPTTVTNGTIQLGASAAGGGNATLSYTGPGETTDRVINLGSNATYTLDQSGSGALHFSSNLAGTMTGTFGLTGSTAADGYFDGNINGGSTLVITKTGTGTWHLTGTNSVKTLNINSNSIVDIGAGALTLSDGGATTLASTTGGTINGTGAITLSGTTGNAGDNTVATGMTLTINAKLTGNTDFEFYPAGGTFVFTNAANDYNNLLYSQTGTVRVPSLGSSGSASPVGKGAINFNGGTDTLIYTGTGETTNHSINMQAATGIVLDQSGTGNLKYTTFGAVTGTAKTLTLQGSTAGTGEISAAIVDNSTANTTAVTKAGTGTWILSGTNTYTGATTVNGGTLMLKTGTTNNSAVAVNSGGTLSVQGNYSIGNSGIAAKGGSLVLAAGGTLDLTDGLINTLTLTQNSTFATAGAAFTGGTIKLDVSGTGADSIVNSGGTVGSTSSGSTAIVVNPLSGFGIGVYTIISGGAGTGSISNSNFYLASSNLNVGGAPYTLALSQSGTNELLTITVGANGTVPGSTYWNGTNTASWAYQPGGAGTATNWSASSTGPDANSLPGSTTNVTFTSNSATNLSTTLDQSWTINSLTFTGTTTANTAGSTIASGAGGPYMLTLNAAAVNGATAGNGINVAAGSGANTINANVALGASQTWTNNSTNPLTVSGVISENSAGLNLTLAGGPIALNGANTYTGITTINAGATLSTNNVANGGFASGLGGMAPNAATNIVFAGNSTLAYTGATATSDRAFTINAGVTLTVDVAGNANLTLAGATGTATTGALTKVDTGTLTLTGANTYTGNTTINAGKLNITGSLTGLAASSKLNINPTAGNNAVVNYSGGTSVLNAITGTTVAGTASAFNQSNGSITITPGTGTGTQSVAGVVGGYGFYGISGGTLHDTNGTVGGERFTLSVAGTNVNINTATSGAGIVASNVYISGTGAIDHTNAEWVLNYGLSEVTLADSGKFDNTGSNNHIGIIMDTATTGGSYGVLNIAGSGAQFLVGNAASIQLGNSASNGSGNTALLNLAAGTLSSGANISTSLNPTGGNAFYFNAAGGTLKSTAALTQFTPTAGASVNVVNTIFGAIDNSALTGAPSFAGGLTLDSTGGTITIPAAMPLLGATNNGVTQANLTVSGGAGYIGAPDVIFSKPALSTGVPAAGYALMSGGSVVGIVITDPGVYGAGETLTVTLIGGSAATPAAVTCSALNTANSNTGGLTKVGSGQVIISGSANTFGGAVDIKAGALSVTSFANGAAASALGASSNAASNILLDGGVLDYAGTTAVAAPGTTDRQFTFAASGGGFSASGTTAGTFTVNTSQIVINPSLGAANFQLAGSGTGTTGGGTLNGVLADGTGTTIGLLKSGAGQWTLGSAANTYSGGTTLSGGTLTISKLDIGGNNSAIGKSTNAAANLVLQGGTLQYTGTGDTTDRNFTFGNATTAAGGGIDNEGTGPLVINGSMTGANTAAGTQVLSLTAAAASGNNTFNSNIVDSSGTALTAVNKAGAGTWTLSGTNTNTGGTTISAGTLIATNVNALGATASTVYLQTSTSVLQLSTDSGFGSPLYNVSLTNSVAASPTISLNRATAGASNSITHNFGTLTMAELGGLALTLNVVKGANGTSALDTIAFTGLLAGNNNTVTETLNPTGGNVSIGTVASVSTNASTVTIDLDGTTAGNIITGIISGGTEPVAITKSNTSTWTLSGANTYTGATAVNGGALLLGNGGSLANTSGVTVSNATFGVTQNLSSTSNSISTITLNSGSSLTMADGYTSTLNVTGAATLAPASGTGVVSPILTFDISGSNFDQMAVTGAATAGTAGAKIAIPPSTTQITAGTYTLIAGGASSALSTNFSLASSFLPNVGGLYTLSLGSTATALKVTVAADSNAVYWAGSTSGDWNTAGNWRSSIAGGGAGSVPGSTSDVVLSTTTPVPGNLTNSLSAGLTVNSVSFLPGSGSATVGGSNTLTINGGGIFNASSNAQTINTPIALNAAQTWTNTSSSLFTVGGNIGGSYTLTHAGTGTTVLSGTNSFTGLTVIGGTVKAGSTQPLATTGTLTVTVPGTFDLGGNNISIATLAASTGTITDSSAAGSGGILKITGSTTTAIAALVTGSAGFQYANTNGSNALFSNAANTYSGGTYLGEGTLSARYSTGAVTVGNGVGAALTSGIFGTGPIYIGRATADNSQIYVTGALTINNPITYNSVLGTDVVGGVRLDTGATFNGIQTAYLSAISYGSYASANTLTVTGQLTGSGTFTGTITGNNGGNLGGGTVIGTGASFIVGASASAVSTVILNNASANNNYTGDTYVTAKGVLQTNAANQLPSGTGTGNVYLNGTFKMQGFNQAIGALSGTGTLDGVSGSPILTVGGNNATQTFSGIVQNTAGNLALVKIGTGIQTLSGSNTYTGGTTISAGTLQLGGGSLTGALSLNSAITDNSILSFNRTNTITQGTDFATVIGGTGAVKQAGTGILVLNGLNTYTGGTSLSAGTLAINSTQALSTGALTLAGGTLDNTSTGAIVNANNNLQNWNANFAFAGTHDLNLGTGAVTLSAACSVTVNGGNLTVGGSLTGATFGLTKLGVGTLTLNSAIGTTTGGLTIGANATPQNNGGVVILSGSNTFTGGITNNAGDLVLTNNNNNLGIGTKTYTASAGTNGNPQLILDPGAGGGITLGSSISYTTSNTSNGVGLYNGVKGTIISYSGNNTINGNFTLTSGGGGTVLTNYASGTLFTFNGNFTPSAAGRNLVLCGDGNGLINGVIYDASTSGGNLSAGVQKNDIVGAPGGSTGTWTLAGANAYGSPTTINTGTLAVTTLTNGGQAPTITTTAGSATATVSSATGLAIGMTISSAYIPAGTTISNIVGTTLTLSSGTGVTAGANTAANIGSTSSLGIATNAATNLIINGGTLRYIGSAVSTDRLFQLGNVAGSALDASGTGALNLTNTGAMGFANDTTTSRTLNLTGTNTGLNTLAALIGNPTTSGTTAVNKTGPGTWVLSNANTYTGSTSVTTGKLAITGSILGSPIVNVSGGTLTTSAANELDPLAAVTVTGGLLTLAGNNTVGTFNLSGGTLGGTGILTAGSYNISSGSTVTTALGGGTLAAISGTNILNAVSASAAINLSGGTLQMGAGNLLTGTPAVTFSGGTLDLYGYAATIGSLTDSIGSGLVQSTGGTGILTVAPSGSTQFMGVLQNGAGGTLGLVVNGTGTQILSGSNTYTGGTTITAGSLQIGAGLTAGSISSTSSITDNGNLTFNRSDNLTQGTDFVTISGAGSLIQAGGGTLFLTGSNTYTGGTIINSGGTVQVGNGGTTGTPGTGPVTNNGTLIFNRSNTITQGTDFGTISGSGALTQSGSGNLVLTGSNSYTGITTLNSGTLSVSNLAGATDSLGGSNTFNGALVLNGGTLNYTGTDVVTQRTFSLNQTGGGAVTITSTGGGALNFTPASSASDAIGKPSGPTTLTLAGDGSSANTLGLKLSDTGTAAAVSLVKAGGGTWILGAGIDDAYVKYPGLWSGGTTISGGKLQLGASEALPSLTTFAQSRLSGSNSVGNVQVSGGATLDLNGHVNTLNSLGGSGTVTSSAVNGMLALGAVGSTFGGTFGGSITDSGTGTLALVKFGNGTLTLSGTNTYSGGTTIQTGTVVLGSATALPANQPLTMSPANNATDSANPTLDLGGHSLSLSSLTGTATANAVVPLTLDHIVVEGWNYTAATTGFHPTQAAGGDVIELFNSSNQPILPSGLLVGQTFNAPGYPSGTTIKSISGLYVQLSSTFTGTLGSNNQATISNGTWSFGAYSAAGSTPVIGNSGGNLATLTVDTTSGSAYAGLIQDAVSSSDHTSHVALYITGSTAGNSLVLSGNNTYTGGTVLSSGTLVAGVSNVGSASGAFGATNGTTGLVTLGDAATTAANASPALLIGGPFTVANPLTVAGQATSGTYTIGGSTADTATFTGAITLNEPVTLVAAAGGTVQLNTLTTNNQALTVGTTGYTGTVALGNPISTTGGVQVNCGTLAVATSGLSATTPVTVGANGTLSLGGANTVASFTLGGGTLGPATTATLTAPNYYLNGGAVQSLLGPGTITVAGGTTALGSAGRLSSGTNPLAINSGALLLGGAETVASFTLGGGTLDGNGGVQTLTAATYALNGGTINTNANLGSTGTVTVSSGTTNLYGQITGSTLNINGGTLVLDAGGSLANTPAVTFTGGTLSLNGYAAAIGNLSGTSGQITGSAGSVLAVTAATGTTYGGTIAGSVALTKTGGGTLNLSGANTYTGTTTIQNGILQVTADQALGTTAGGTTVANNAALQLAGVNYATTEALQINGTGLGSGALLNSGNSTFAGAITAVSSSTINGGSGLLTLTGNVTKDGTTLTLSGNVNVKGIIGGVSANSDLWISGGTTTLSSANTYNGPTVVYGGGTLINGVNDALPDINTAFVSTNTTLTLGHGETSGTNTYDLAGYTQILNGLSTNSSGTTVNQVISSNLAGGPSSGTGVLTVNIASGTNTFDGSLGGTGAATNFSLAKTGSGTLALAGSNTYTGGTIVTDGTLAVTGSLVNNGADHVQVHVSRVADTFARVDGTLAGAPMITRAVANGDTYGTLSAPKGTTAITDTTTGTTANIVYGTNTQAATSVGMQWVAQSTADTNIVFSDILILSGMTSDTFVLEMTFDTTGLTNNPFLGQETALGVWQRAVDFNGSGNHPALFANTAWTSALTGLGDYGFTFNLDGHTGTAWAVLDHNGTFAVIPEPTSLGLLGLGALGLLARRGKRKA